MDFLRNKLKSKIAKIILWVLIFSLLGASSLLISLQYYLSNQAIEPWVAKVNKEKIETLDLVRRTEKLKYEIAQIKKMFGNQANSLLSMWGIDPQKSAYETTLDNIISENILLSAAKQVGINIPTDYTRKKLHDAEFIKDNLSELIPKELFKEDNLLDIEMLNNFLEMQKISYEEFDQMIKDKLTRNFYINLISAGSYVTKENIETEYKKLYSKKKYEIIKIDKEKLLSKIKKQKLTEKEIEGYYNQNKEKYRKEETRSGTVWEFGIKNEKEFNKKAKSITADNQSPELLKEFLEKNKAIKKEVQNISGKENTDISKKLFLIKEISGKSYYTEQTNNNKKTGHIIELKKINKSYIPELPKIKIKIEEDIYSKKSEEELKKETETIKKETETKSLEKIAKENKNKFTKTTFIDPLKIEQEIKDKKIELPENKLNEIAREIEINKIIYSIDKNGSFIIKLVEIEPIEENKLQEERGLLYNKLINKINNKNIKETELDLKNNAQITINKKTIQKLK